MKTRNIIALAASFLMAYGVQAQGQVNSWLHNDCSEGEADSPAQTIAAMSNDHLKYDLEQALANGPSTREIEKVRTHASKTYDRNMEFLNTDKASFLSTRQVERIKSVSKEEFVDREEANYITRYKDQAKIGLDLVNQLGTSYDVTLKTTPSPANNDVQFSFVLPENSNYRVELYDVSGKMLGQIHEGSASKHVPVRFNYNTSGLSEGIYMYKVIANERVFVDKFIIRR